MPAAVLRRSLEALWAALFPARCLGCGRRDTALCAACTAALPPIPTSVCPRCASRWSAGGTCRVCRQLPAALRTVRAAYAYDGLARKAIHTLKFRQGRYLAPVLGGLLREAVARRPLHAEIVLPAPIAPARLRSRGYNQAALLAAEIVGAVGGELRTDVLTRADRPPQQSLSAGARRRNLAGAVRCLAPATVAGRRVLVVDDVMTTGATLAECARALAEAGAGWVGALVFSRDL